MSKRVSVSIDVPDMERAIGFYSQALGCELKEQYSDDWNVVSIAGMEIHLQVKAAGSTAAAEHRRDYGRHWTPVHLDFTVDDIRPSCLAIEKHGGSVENQSFSTDADIAHCADPFGNGFCVIRE